MFYYRWKLLVICCWSFGAGHSSAHCTALVGQGRATWLAAPGWIVDAYYRSLLDNQWYGGSALQLPVKAFSSGMD